MTFDFCGNVPEIAIESNCHTYDRRLARSAIFNAWDNCCAYCGETGADTLDHVLPRFRGGLSETKNLIPCCRHCNQDKGSKLFEDWYPRKSFYSLSQFELIQQWRSLPWA